MAKGVGVVYVRVRVRARGKGNYTESTNVRKLQIMLQFKHQQYMSITYQWGKEPTVPTRNQKVFTRTK